MWRQTFALISLLFVSGSFVGSAWAQDVGPPPAWATSDGYLLEVRQAGVQAAQFLWLAGEPIFRGEGLYATGGVPTSGHVSVAILFPTRLDSPQYLGRPQSLSFCNTIVPNPYKERAAHVIACDPESIRLFEILVRLAHSPVFVDRYMRNDWSLIEALERIRRDPVSLMKEAGPTTISDSHVRMHVGLLLAFLYAHEAYHLAHGSAETFDDPIDDESPVTDADLRRLELCRNYKEFTRQGRKMFGDPAEPIEKEGTTKSELLRSEVTSSRRQWVEELEADRYAASQLVNIVAALRAQGMEQADLEEAFLSVLFNFGNLTLLKWQAKIAPMARSACAPYAGMDFYLTWCMSEKTSNYAVAQSLLSATHPAIALRMSTASQAFIEGVGRRGIIESGLTASPRLTSAMAWYFLVDSLTDTPMKIAMTQCAQLTEKAVSITQIFPDLAGLFGSDRSKTYPGYPANEQKLLEAIMVKRKILP